METALNRVREFHRRIDAPVADGAGLLACQRATAEALAGEIRGLLDRCHSHVAAGDMLVSRLCLALEELAEWVERHLETACQPAQAAVDGQDPQSGGIRFRSRPTCPSQSVLRCDRSIHTARSCPGNTADRCETTSLGADDARPSRSGRPDCRQNRLPDASDR